MTVVIDEFEVVPEGTPSPAPAAAPPPADERELQREVEDVVRALAARAERLRAT